MILSDWLWVARERSLGDSLVFYPSSSTLGAVMVTANSPIKAIADLKGKKLARRRRPARQELAPAAGARAPLRRRPAQRGDDRLRRAAAAVAKGAAGRERRHADVLEFLRRTRRPGHEARDRHGRRDEEPRRQGPVAIVGFVFDGNWAARNRVGGRPLPRCHAPGQGNPRRTPRPNGSGSARASASAIPKALAIYRERYREGIPHRPIAEEEADARALYQVLAEVGGTDLVGTASELDTGTFYRRGRRVTVHPN